MMAGAAVGGAMGETAAMMFRSRDAPGQQGSFLDARSLNHQNESVRPTTSRAASQPTFPRPTQPTFQRMGESASGSDQTPNYHYIASRSASRDRADVMRPTTAPTSRPRDRSPQTAILETAEMAPARDRARLTRNRGGVVIQGEPNPGMLADRVPKGSQSDVLQATGAPRTGATGREAETTQGVLTHFR